MARSFGPIGIAALLVLGGLNACVAPTRSLPMRGGSGVGSGRDPIVQPIARPNRPAPLELRRTVDVILSTVESEPKVTVVSQPNGQVTVARTPNGIIAEGSGRPPVQGLLVPGPVRIGEVLHGGDVRFVPGPSGGLRAIARLPLDTYIAAVVAAEIPLWSAEPAELEAQAIAARTFALHTLRTRAAAGEPAELLDGVLDQAYHGSYEPGTAAGAQRAAARLADAVRATAGLCLMRGDSLEEARYHASCGGHTATFEDIFASEVASRGAKGPIGVRCPSCERRAKEESVRRAPDPERPLGWVTELDPHALAVLGKALGLSGRVSRLFPVKRDRGGRWLEVQVEGPNPADSRRVTFEALRNAAGYSVLKGATIGTTLPRPGDPIPQGTTLRLQGRGRGHGVGLCQESLRELARTGWTSNQILRHYYPGARTVRLPDASGTAPQP